MKPGAYLVLVLIVRSALHHGRGTVPRPRPRPRPRHAPLPDIRRSVYSRNGDRSVQLCAAVCVCLFVFVGKKRKLTKKFQRKTQRTKLVGWNVCNCLVVSNIFCLRLNIFAWCQYLAGPWDWDAASELVLDSTLSEGGTTVGRATAHTIELVEL